MNDDLPTHITDARQFLSPEKVRLFEESYRRMRLRARNWDAGIVRDELKVLLDAPRIEKPAGD